MKILMTADTVGGVWTYCMDLCAALAPHGVHIALATMGRALSDEQHRQVDQLANVTLYESTYRLCWMQDAWGDVNAAGKWLSQLEREIRPDLVHLNDLAHGGLSWHAPVLLVAHSCVYSWWDAVRGQTAPAADWQRYHGTVRQSVRQASLVAAPTRAMLDAFLKHYGPARSGAVIHNGRDFPALAPSPALAHGRKQALIFAAGRVWDEAKNIGTLAATAHDLPWPVFVAGETTDPNGGTANAEGVHCLGFLSRNELQTWLERAAIYVAPARYEPFGLAILEAARAGCALVLGDIPSLREVWGEAAVYVDPDDSLALCQAVTALTENPARRQRLAERAWRAAQGYGASAMAEAYLEQYHTLLRSSATSSHSTRLHAAGAPL